MKRKILIFFMSVFLFFTGCYTSNKVLYDISEISTIEIVAIERDANAIWTYTSLYVIEDKETFLNEFSQIHCYNVFPPRGVELGETAIKFLYYNGESEFFNECGRTMLRYESAVGEIIRLTGSHCLDKADYNALIEKYYKTTT